MFIFRFEAICIGGTDDHRDSNLLKEVEAGGIKPSYWLLFSLLN